MWRIRESNPGPAESLAGFLHRRPPLSPYRHNPKLAVWIIVTERKVRRKKLRRNYFFLRGPGMFVRCGIRPGFSPVRSAFLCFGIPLRTSAGCPPLRAFSFFLSTIVVFVYFPCPRYRLPEDFLVFCERPWEVFLYL